MATIVTAAELAGDVEAFLGFKRAMGAPYRRGQWDLERFLRFVARQWGEHG
jgi:integrase/recombinase XerD